MNTEKITENKYLCPLSGKKFKGPEFVKKHIFNKHMEKVEAVKQEVCVALFGCGGVVMLNWSLLICLASAVWT